jgi:hypothetical protein
VSTRLADTLAETPGNNASLFRSRLKQYQEDAVGIAKRDLGNVEAETLRVLAKFEGEPQ